MRQLTTVVSLLAILAAIQTQAATTGFNQTAAGPFDYNTQANWVGSTINGIWDSSLTLAAGQTVTFAADTTLTTGLTFNYAGNYGLTLDASAAGTRNLTLGGNISLNTGGGTTANVTIGNSANHLNVNLNGVTRTFNVAASRTLTFNDVLSNGGILSIGAGTLALNGASSYSASTTISNGIIAFNGSGNISSSALTVGQQTGSGNIVTMTVTPTAAGTTTRSTGLTWNGSAAGNNQFVSVNNFTVNGAAGNTIEQFGPLTLNSGLMQPSVAANAAGNLRVVFDSITRNPGTALYFGRSATQPGVSSTSSQTANSANVVFTTPPTLVGGGGAAGNPAISILPYASVTTGGGLATYDSTYGLRTLAASESVGLPASGLTGGSTNVTLAASVSLTANESVNSLVLNYFNGIVTLNNKTLTVASGTIMNRVPTTIGSAVNDGFLALGAEGHFFMENQRLCTINSVITGSSGLTVSFNDASGNAASLVLAGTNTFSGITTVVGNLAGTYGSGNQLSLTLSNSLALQNSTLDYNNYGAGIYFAPAVTAFTLGGLKGAQPLPIPTSTTLTIGSAGDSDSTTYSGVLSGDTTGSLVKAGGGTLTLKGANTYAGPTAINGGALNAGIAQNGTTSGPLGKSGTISFGGGTLQYSAANQQDYSPRFSVAAGQPYSIDCNGTTISFGTALVSSAGTLTVTNSTGSGKLTLAAAGNSYSGATTIKAGTLALGASATIPNTPSITVSNGATFDVSAVSGYTLGGSQSLLGSGTVHGAVATASGSSLYPATDGAAGTLAFDSNLNMGNGGGAYFDLSTNFNTGNDQIAVGGNLTLSSSDTIHIKALSGAANLDATSDYVLFAVSGATTLTTTPALIFDGTTPANLGNFIVQKSSNNVVLHYNSSTAPAVSASVSPTSVVRGQSVTINATVTPGSGTVTSVAVNLTLIGGSANQALTDSGDHIHYSYTTAVSTSAAVGSPALTVTVVDNALLSGSASPVLTINASAEIWNGQAADNNWSSGANWASALAPGLSGDSLIFDGTARLAPSMNASYSVSGVLFPSTAGSFIIGAANGSTLTLSGNGVTNNSTSLQTLNVPVALSGPAQLNAAAGDLAVAQTIGIGGNVLTVGGAHNTTAGGGISGSGGLTKSDAGTLDLGGASDTVGMVTVAGGTIQNGTLAGTGAGPKRYPPWFTAL